MAAAYLPAWRVALAAAGVAVPLSVGTALGIPLTQKLGTAMARAATQLTLLGGLILTPLMQSTSPLLVFSYVMLMILISGYEAANKLPWHYSGLRADCFTAAIAGAGVAAFAGICIVIQPSPWYSAQTVIPVFGMVLGNGLDAVGLGLRTYCTSVGTRPAPVRLAIGFGASRFEAVQPCVAEAVLTAMVPKPPARGVHVFRNQINSMTVAGLVSIPGMMTGQVLAGQDPSQASRYQIMILYLIAAGSLSSVGLALFLASRRLVDSAGRLRLDLLSRQGSADPMEGLAVHDATGSQVIVTAVKETVVPGPAVVSVPRVEVFAAGQSLYVLKGLELTEGEICGVTGPSGAGKTTLLDMLAMNLPPMRVIGAEEIAMRGQTFDQLGGSAWRAGCLVVPQSIPQITQVTCSEWFSKVLQFSIWSHRDEAAAMRDLATNAAAMLLPKHALDSEMASLSGGERHRVMLACALTLAPPVLLLDEPTAALDADSAAAVEAQLSHFVERAKSVIVMVSHDMALVKRLSHKLVTLGGPR